MRTELTRMRWVAPEDIAPDADEPVADPVEPVVAEPVALPVLPLDVPLELVLPVEPLDPYEDDDPFSSVPVTSILWPA